jgi:hypothetical protein
MPAKAGIQVRFCWEYKTASIPACAGMTGTEEDFQPIAAMIASRSEPSASNSADVAPGPLGFEPRLRRRPSLRDGAAPHQIHFPE